jgi:hypothetical protein
MSFSLYCHYMFRPNQPSLIVQVVVMKDSATVLVDMRAYITVEEPDVSKHRNAVNLWIDKTLSTQQIR